MATATVDQQTEQLIRVGFTDGGMAIIDELGDVHFVTPRQFEDELDRIDNERIANLRCSGK